MAHPKKVHSFDIDYIENGELQSGWIAAEDYKEAHEAFIIDNPEAEIVEIRMECDLLDLDY